MRNLLRFIVQHHFLILFLTIEAFTLFLLFSANPYQRTRYYNFAHSVSGRISTRMENITDYFSLRLENRKLAEENARLYNRLEATFTTVISTRAVDDSLRVTGYRYLTAKVINSSVNKQFNYITLDKGKLSGIEPEMAVIGSEGIVGIVKAASDNYSSVLSALNRDFIVSAKIKKNGYFGPMRWNGNNPEFATLVDIPHHVKIEKGDTVVTSGFGGVFPEGFLVGTISEFRLKGGNYFEIRIRLSTDFRKLDYVQVIRNMARNEIDSLENTNNP